MKRYEKIITVILAFFVICLIWKYVWVAYVKVVTESSIQQKYERLSAKYIECMSWVISPKE